MNFCFAVYYIFLHTDLWTRRKNTKKRKRKVNIYTSQTNTQLHAYKKETNETNPSTFFSIYMKKSKSKINKKERLIINEVSGEEIVC